MKKALLLFMMIIAVSGNNVKIYAGEQTWTCPKCGYEASYNFCGNCGTAKPGEEWICSNCGEAVTGNFCNHCGNSREESGENIAADAGYTGTEKPDNTSVYNVIIAEYRAALATYASIKDMDYYGEYYANVNFTLLRRHYTEPEYGQICYAYYDIDGNGKDELLIGFGRNDGTEIPYFDVFTSDGQTVRRFFNNNSLGYRSFLTIYTDGTIHFQGANGAADGTCQCWTIGQDGVTPTCILDYEYHYDTSGGLSYTVVSGSMPPEEYEKSLSSKTYIEVSGWRGIEE